MSVNPPPLRRQRDTQTHHHYPVGSTVEIQIKTAYFLATVLPHSPQPTNSLYVNYHTILADKTASDRTLQELVDVSFVRPSSSPHENAAGVGPNDAVDAFNDGGWWRGVVERVLESGKRFLVNLGSECGTREFGIGELRVHWDWVDGLWSRPEKTDVATMAEVGGKVELSADNGNPHHSWSVVKVLGKLISGRLSVAICDANGNNGRPSSLTADLANVRPCPPTLSYKSFVFGNVVDAYCNFGWLKGVIVKVNEGRSYTVYFERTKTHRIFHESLLRMHMEWMGGAGKWFICPQENLTLPETGDSCAEIERQNRKSPNRRIDSLEIPPQCLPLAHVDDTQPDTNDSCAKVLDERLLDGVETPAEVAASKRKPVEVIMINSDDETGEQTSSEHQSNIQRLPFYKASPLWKTVEAMDVFQQLPQKPHFQPLKHCKEHLREGSAIALMVNFSIVVKQVTELQLNDCCSITDDILVSLGELEIHGFEVVALRERVVKLLALKEKWQLCVQDDKESESRLLAASQRKCDAEKNINAIKEDLEKLKERLSQSQTTKDNVDSGLATLQARMKEVKGTVGDLALEFDDLACMKW